MLSLLYKVEHSHGRGFLLHSNAYLQATSAKHYEEKDARLEYLSWRVWFMKRNRARVLREDARILAAEKVELQDEDDKQVLDTEDAGSEGEEEMLFDPKASMLKADRRKPPRPTSDTAPQPEKGVKPIATKSDRKTQDLPQEEEASGPQDVTAFFDRRVDGLYIILISLHGLVRGQQMELGKDPDTGGQVQTSRQSNTLLCLLCKPHPLLTLQHMYLLLFSLSTA